MNAKGTGNKAKGGQCIQQTNLAGNTNASKDCEFNIVLACRDSRTSESEAKSHTGPSNSGQKSSKIPKKEAVKCGYCSVKQKRTESFGKDLALIAGCPPWARLQVNDAFCPPCLKHIRYIHTRHA